MERSVMDITLELTQSYSHTQVTVKRGDTHRSLRIHLADGGRPYRMGENCTAVFTAVKPDGSHLFNACRVEEDTIGYDLTPQTTALPGQLECELRLYGDNGALLTSAAFGITVADTVYADGDENIASTGEVTALTKLVGDATEKITQMETVLKNEVNHATIDDSKVGADAWSSKNIADKFCPAFTESGSLVTCLPLEGYPLEVVSKAAEAGELTLTRCGKNLFDFQQGVYPVTYTGQEGNKITRYGYAIQLPAGTYTLMASNTRTESNKYIYGKINGADGTSKGDCDLVTNTSRPKKTVTIADGDIIYIYDGISQDTIEQANTAFSLFDIQIEAGSVATDYETYRGQTYIAEVLGAGAYTWQEIPALSGVNYLYSPSGSITVTGRKDLLTLLQNL